MRNVLVIMSLMLVMFLGNAAIAGDAATSDSVSKYPIKNYLATAQPIRNTLRGVKDIVDTIAPLRRIGRFLGLNVSCQSCTEIATEKEE